MAKLLLVLFLFLAPFRIVWAKEFTLPSGLKVNIPDVEIKYILKEFTLPSGFRVWAEALPHVAIARAADLTLEEEIKLWIVMQAQKFKISSDGMIALAKCEALFDP